MFLFDFVLSVQRVGRLLPAGDAKWVHANCAVWSHGARERSPGTLHRLHTILACVKKQVAIEVTCNRVLIIIII